MNSGKGEPTAMGPVYGGTTVMERRKYHSKAAKSPPKRIPNTRVTETRRMRANATRATPNVVTIGIYQGTLQTFAEN